MKDLQLETSAIVLGLACLVGSYGVAQGAAPEATPGVLLKDFADHGVPARVSESRGRMAIREKSGAPLIVAIARDLAAGVPRCTGGGLITYDAATRETKAKPAKEILPNHSTLALGLLNNQTVVGGTTIEAMGGGHVVATEAELYFWDIATQTVTFHTAPIPGARAINALHVGSDGKVYGLTNNAQFFVFDPQTKTVIHRAYWTQWVVAFNPGYSLWRAPNGRIGVMLPKVILEIQPDYSVRKLADLPAPASAGAVVLNNRLYFATGSNVRSVGLAP